MIRSRELRVETNEAGLRLDRFLLDRLEGVSRAGVVEAIAAGRVRVNGGRAVKARMLEAGDRIQVAELAQRADHEPAPNPELPLDVVYEDDALIVVHKPAGQPVHPQRAGETRTLASALVARHPELAGVGDVPRMPGLLHRIDTETSGLVLAARTPEAFRFLRGQFTAHTAEKVYLALVRGVMDGTGRTAGFLVHASTSPCRMRVLDPGEPVPAGRRALKAETAYGPLWQGTGLTLVRAVIFTGVTHQIRCHLAAAGRPIVGDRIYGSPEDAAESRHYLHAWTLRIRHPADGAWRTFAVPPPAGFLSRAGLDAETFERILPPRV